MSNTIFNAIFKVIHSINEFKSILENFEAKYGSESKCNVNMDFTLKETITLKNIECLGYVFEKAFDFAGKTDFSICHILPNLFGIKKPLMELQQSGIGESYLVSSSFIDGTSDTDEEKFMEENEFGEEKLTLIQQNLLEEEFIQFKNYVIAEVESKIKYYQNDLIYVATLLNPNAAHKNFLSNTEWKNIEYLLRNYLEEITCSQDSNNDQNNNNSQNNKKCSEDDFNLIKRPSRCSKFDEIDEYLDIIHDEYDGSSQNVLKFWIQNCNRFKNLSKFGIKFAMFPGTSVGCERIISKYSYIFTKQRKSLNIDNLINDLIVCCNI